MLDLAGQYRTRNLITPFIAGAVIDASVPHVGAILLLGQGVKTFSFGLNSAGSRAGVLTVFVSDNGVDFNPFFAVTLVAGVPIVNLYDNAETSAAYAYFTWAPTGGTGTIAVTFNKVYLSN